MDTGVDPKLVVGLSLEALFTDDSTDPSPQGSASRPMQPGPAMPLVRRLLGINERAGKRLVEVVVVSEAGHNTALQVMTSARKHDLEVVGWAFTDGRPVWPYLDSLQCNLYLSTSTDAIVAAVDRDVAAARILPVDEAPEGATDGEVRILLDGDAVLFDAGSQQIYESKGLAAFVDNETRHADVALTPGPRAPFFAAVGRINRTFPADERPIRLSLLTGRNAVAHEKIVAALDDHGVGVSETVLVGGLDKSAIMGILRPHIHFDEHTRHLAPERGDRPSSAPASASIPEESTATEPSSAPKSKTEPEAEPEPSSPAADAAETPRTTASDESTAAATTGSGPEVSPGLARATATPRDSYLGKGDDTEGPPPPPPAPRSEAGASTVRAREHTPASITPAPPAPPVTPPATSDTAAEVTSTSEADESASPSGVEDGAVTGVGGTGDAVVANDAAVASDAPADSEAADTATGRQARAGGSSASPTGLFAARRARRSDDDGDDGVGGEEAPTAGDADGAGDAQDATRGEDAIRANGSSDVVVIDGIGGDDTTEDEDDAGDSTEDAAASGRRGLFRRGR